jgi:CheY-like chemotaxis protein
VRRHRGAINVSSTPGQGTTFEIYIPQATESEGERSEKPAKTRGKGEHILVVDDEHEIVEAARTTLERIGYRITAETSAKDALVTFESKKTQFNMAIVDFALPEMNGLELSSRLLSMKPDLPIVLVTGFSGALDRGEMEKTNVKKLINKPISAKELGEIIRQVLDEKK